MSNVVGFLERMGQDAQLRYASGSELERALIEAQIDTPLRAAIMDEDEPDDDGDEPGEDDSDEEVEPKAYRRAAAGT